MGYFNIGASVTSSEGGTTHPPSSGGGPTELTGINMETIRVSPKSRKMIFKLSEPRDEIIGLYLQDSSKTIYKQPLTTSLVRNETGQVEAVRVESEKSPVGMIFSLLVYTKNKGSDE